MTKKRCSFKKEIAAFLIVFFFGRMNKTKTQRKQSTREVIVMLGLIMSVIAGAAMSVQGVLNTRLSSKIGLFESNVFVQGTAFLIGVLVMWIFGKGNFRELLNTPKVYWLGGILGMVITVTVMLSIKGLSPTYAISVILVSQLLVAALIDAFGWFESEQVPFTWTKYVGLFLMISGVILFQWQKGS